MSVRSGSIRSHSLGVMESYVNEGRGASMASVSSASGVTTVVSSSVMGEGHCLSGTSPVGTLYMKPACDGDTSDSDRTTPEQYSPTQTGTVTATNATTQLAALSSCLKTVSHDYTLILPHNNNMHTNEYQNNNAEKKYYCESCLAEWEGVSPARKTRRNQVGRG